MEETVAQDSQRAYAPGGIGSRLVRKGATALNSAVAKEKAAIDHELSYLAGSPRGGPQPLLRSLRHVYHPCLYNYHPKHSDTPAHEYVGFVKCI